MVVDRDARVALTSVAPATNREELRDLISEDRRELTPRCSRLVRECIAALSIASEQKTQSVAQVTASCIARVVALNGPGGERFAVAIERVRHHDGLARAARRFSLTPRETDVLSSVLAGASASETARALDIAESTVQIYHKRLLRKTDSRSRTAMAALVLDWKQSGVTRRRTTRS